MLLTISPPQPPDASLIREHTIIHHPLVALQMNAMFGLQMQLILDMHELDGGNDFDSVNDSEPGYDSDLSIG